MKSAFLTLLIVFVALGTAPVLSAKNPATDPHPHVLGELFISQVPALVPANGDLVTHGTSRIMVSLRLGRPNIVLPDGSWLYRDYQLDEVNARPGALIVRFVSNRVSELSIADNIAVLALREPTHHTPEDQFLAATQKR